MGHSRAEKAESRERILDAAARQIRQGGLQSMSIAQLMNAANLTHGGFYGHFASRSALIAAALERAVELGEAAFVAAKPADAGSTVKSIVNRYLSPAHRDSAAEGCAIAALASDVGRENNPGVRKSMAQRLEQNFADMTKAMGNGPGAEAVGVATWCAMVGALTLSRVFEGKRSDDILRMTRQSILDLEAQVQVTTKG